MRAWIARKVAPAARAETIARLTDAGAVDDERFARSRAQALAERGAGDLLVRHDLEARGIAAEAVEAAIASLEPENVRAARICARRGAGPKTARYLARKGFSDDAIESVVRGSHCRARPSGCTMREQQHEVLPAHAQFPNRST